MTLIHEELFDAYKALVDEIKGELRFFEKQMKKYSKKELWYLAEEYPNCTFRFRYTRPRLELEIRSADGYLWRVCDIEDAQEEEEE